MNNIIWRALGEIFRKFSVFRSGIYEDNGRTIRYEQTQFITGRFTITIVAEEVLEDLQSAIDQAIAEENYELADQLTKKLESFKKKNDENRTGSI